MADSGDEYVYQETPFEDSGHVPDTNVRRPIQVGNAHDAITSGEQTAGAVESSGVSTPKRKTSMPSRRPSAVELSKESMAVLTRKDNKLKNMIAAIETETPQRTRFMMVIHHQAHWLRFWTVVLALALIYLCTSIPVLLAFEYPPLDSPWRILILLADIIVELAFIGDIFLNFHLGYTDSSGTEILQPLQIRQRYVRGWLALDIITLLPLDMGVTQVGAYLRALKMLRFFPVMTRISSLEVQAGVLASFSRIIKLGFPLFLVFHVAACFWISFGTHGGFGSTIFAPSVRIGETGMAGQYIWALFWSLSVLSNCSIPEGSPTNNMEALFCVIFMTAGLGAISYVVGAIGALMEQKNSNRREHERRLRDIVKFMEFNEIPNEIQKRVMSYMEYKWTANSGFQPDVMFETLPMSLKQTLSVALARDIVDQVPLFTLLSSDALNAVVTKMKPILVMPMDYIYKLGRPSDTMYFIRVGEIHAIAHSSKFDFHSNDERNNASVYGVESLMMPDAFGVFESLVLKKYIISVRAATFVDLYSLTTEDMFEALAEFPDQTEIIRDQIQYNMSKDRKTQMMNTIQEAVLEDAKTAGIAGPQSMGGSRRSVCIPTGVNPMGFTAAQTPVQNKVIASIVQQMLLKPVVNRSAGSTLKMASKLVVAAKKARLRTSLSAATHGAPTIIRSLNKFKLQDVVARGRYYLKHLVIYPTSTFAIAWLWMIRLLNIFNLLSIPFRIVFIRTWPVPGLYAFDYLGDIVYLIDIFLNFHIAFMNHGQLVSQTADISEWYRRTHLYRHVLASLPFDFGMLITGTDAIWRLPKLLRGLDVYFMMHEANSTDDRPWKTLTKKVGALLMEFLLLAHFVACLYFVFANTEGYADSYNRWLPPEYLNDDDQPVRKYLYGLYFSYDMLLRLGVGIVPRSPFEIIFSIGVLLSGVLVVAQLIGSFSSFLQIYDHGESQFKDRMQQLTQYLLKNHVPKKIRIRVVDFYKFHWNDLNGVDMNTVLYTLPDQLRTAVMASLCGPVLDRVPELKKCPYAMRTALSGAFQFEAYSEGSLVFQDGDEAEHMYFVRRGRVDISIEVLRGGKGKSETSLFDVVLAGRYFGETAVFSNQRIRTMTATAKENTHIIKLRRLDFLQVLEKFPDYKHAFTELDSPDPAKYTV